MPALDDDGRVRRWYGTATDIDDLKQAEQAVREGALAFSTLADHIPQLAWMADADGAIFWYNRRWYEYTGTTLDEVQGWGWTRVHHPDHVDQVVSRIRTAFASGELWEDTFPMRRADGVYRWFLSRALPIRDETGAVVRWFGTNTDVTEQLKLERSLRELNETLEAHVDERTRQVRELTAMLTIAEQEERRRIAQLLHDDLQQILYGTQAKVQGGRLLIQQAQRRGEAAADDQERQALIVERLRNAEGLLRSAIEMTRSLTVELSPPILTGAGVVEMLRWLVGRMTVLHGLKVHLDADAVFCVEREDVRVLLFQIVRELLFNVAKHAEASRVNLTVRRMDGAAEIRVEDDGRGFDVQAVEDRPQGGFGLFSVRERLRLLGGQLHIDAAPGEGTCVTMSVPLDACPGSR